MAFDYDAALQYASEKQPVAPVPPDTGNFDYDAALSYRPAEPLPSEQPAPQSVAPEFDYDAAIAAAAAPTPARPSRELETLRASLNTSPVDAARIKRMSAPPTGSAAPMADGRVAPAGDSSGGGAPLARMATRALSENTYVSQQAGSLLADFADFVPSKMRGVVGLQNQSMQAILGPERYARFDQFRRNIPLVGKLGEMGERALDATGRLKDTMKNQLREDALKQGGKAGLAVSELVGAVEEVARNLAMFRTLKVAYGTQANIPTTLASAAVRSAIAAATSETATLADRARAMAVGFLYQATPAASGTLGRLANSDTIARIADIAANTAITMPQWSSMVQRANDAARASGDPNLAGVNLLVELMQAHGSDVAFGLATKAFKAQGKQRDAAQMEKMKAAMDKAVQKVEPPVQPEAAPPTPRTNAELAREAKRMVEGQPQTQEARNAVPQQTTTGLDARQPTGAGEEVGPQVRGQDQAQAQEVGERTVPPPNVPEGMHERKTVTRAAETDSGRGPLAAEAAALREAGENVAPNTPVAQMVSDYRTVADNDPITALEAARNDTDPMSRASRYAGLLYSDRATTETRTTVLDELAKDATTAGTVLRIVREVKMGTPEARAQLSFKMFENWLSATNNKLKPAELERIKARFVAAEQQQGTDAYEQAISDAVTYAVSRVPRWRFAVAAYRYSNVLSNPRSHERNASGNLLQAYLLRPLVLAARPTGGFRDAAIYSKNAAQALGEGWDAFKASMRGEGGVGKTMEIAGNTTFDTAMQKRLPRALTLVNRLMEGGDRFFGAMISAGEAARLRANGMDANTAAIRGSEVYADYLFRSSVGQDVRDPSQNVAARVLDAMGMGLEATRKLPAPLGALFRPIFLFVRTPINIAKKGTEASVLGYAANLSKDTVAQGRYKRKYSALTDTQKALVDEVYHDRIGARRVGLAVTAIGSVFALIGKTTWSPPQDEKERELFYASGRKPYSVNIGGVDVPMWTLGPLGLSLAIPAAVRDIAVDNPQHADKSLPRRTVEFALQMARFVVEQTPFSSLEQFVNTIGGDEYSVSALGANMAQQMIPAVGFINYVNNFIDPSFRRARTATERVQRGIPGLSKRLPAYREPDNTVAQRKLTDILPPFSVGVRNDEYEQQYKERTQTIRERKVNNRTLDDLMQSWRAGQITDAEIRQFVDGFDRSERSRLISMISEHHAEKDMAKGMRGSGGFKRLAPLAMPQMPRL